ncbi:T9SS type A sorting domain-containing protein [candidate division KSB1 bacterium]|nr:T9SS type A sorting domain-containing protein [candidate division KSB1 bacterium]
MLKYFNVRRGLILAALLGLVFSQHLWAQQKSLTRQYDPIIVSVGKLLPLANDSIGIHTAYCFINGEFRRSRFQIDELNARGELETPDAIADDNDEVIFMPSGVGDRAPTDKWVDGSDDTRLELEVTDPITNEKGWLYLFQHVKNPPALDSHIRYTSDPNGSGADMVEGESYIEGHESTGWFTDIKIKAPFGNDQDILDRLKVRVRGTFVIFGVPVPLTLKESALEFVSVSFTGGEVRGFREISLNIAVAGQNLPATFSTKYLPYSTVFGAKNATIPVVSGLTVTEIRQSVDFNTNASGMAFFNAFNTTGFPVDGTPDSPVNRTILDRTNTNPPDSLNWFMVKGDPGTFLTLLSVPVLGAQRRFYYKDSSAVDSDDTGDMRSYGDSGLQVTSTANITGSLSFNSTTYYLGKDITAAFGDQMKEQTLKPVQATAAEQMRTITAVSEDASQPADFRLDEARPNPFTPQDGSVQISFDLGRTNIKPGLRIFNLLGQEVANFNAANLLRRQTVLWDGRDRFGRLVPAGIYFYELTVGRQRAVKKLILLR